MKMCPSQGQSVSLRRVLPEAEFVGVDDVHVRACVHDSRAIESGDLFVALQGSGHDGHDFVEEAARRGCRAMVVQRPVPDLGPPVIQVSDTRAAHGRVCQALAGHPSRQLKVIGITGTNGKTTTSCLVASMLTTAGYQPGLVGTLGAFDGMDFSDSSLTTPPAEELAQWMARMVMNGCTHGVLEVSSHALAQSRLAGVELDAACVTNVRRDHLDYHRTLGDYRLSKSRLLDHLTDKGFAVINADDPASAAYLARIDTPVMTIGMRTQAEITAVEIEQFTSQQTFLLTAGDESIPVHTTMIGTHHVYNCLVATAVGLAYGIDLPTIVRGLENVGHVPGRLERLDCGQPFSVFVDYAHTPDALTGSLRALRKVVQGRLICVFGAGGDRDRPKRPMMGRAVELDSDLAVITNDNPRSEDPNEIARQLLDGFILPGDAEVILDRREAISWALARAKPGDCVLIAGKGHERTQTIGDEHIPFDDRDVAREWLYLNQPYATAAAGA